MTTRLTISLYQDERDALQMFAEQERREMRAQAALIIRRALERRKLLPNRERVHKPQTPRRAAKESQP